MVCLVNIGRFETKGFIYLLLINLYVGEQSWFLNNLLNLRLGPTIVLCSYESVISGFAETGLSQQSLQPCGFKPVNSTPFCWVTPLGGFCCLGILMVGLFVLFFILFLAAPRLLGSFVLALLLVLYACYSFTPPPPPVPFLGASPPFFRTWYE